MKRFAPLSFVLSLLVFSFVHTALAGGLTTTFGEVMLENLEIGKTYRLEKEANLPLVVENTGSDAVDLAVEVLPADASELKTGFEALPDLSWIRLQKHEFKNIKPKHAAKTDVLISIPNDPHYAGKKYQVFIWSHTVGQAVGVGLKSKLLFSIKQNGNAQ